MGYYTAWGHTYPARELQSPAFPKDPSAPLCPCFHILPDVIEAEAAQGEKTTIQRLIKRAESDEARCVETSPNGKSCVAEARRLFLKHFPGPS